MIDEIQFHIFRYLCLVDIGGLLAYFDCRPRMLMLSWVLSLWSRGVTGVCTAVSSSSSETEDENRHDVLKRSVDDYKWQLDEQLPVDELAKRAPSFRLGKRFDSSEYLLDSVERRAPTFRLGKRLQDDKRAPGFRLGRRAPGFRLG